MPPLRNPLRHGQFCSVPVARACRGRPGLSSLRPPSAHQGPLRARIKMKVTVERAQLLKSLGHVHRVVERRNTIPILANVLIRAEKSKLGAESDRSRSRSERDHRGRGVARRLDHGARAYDLRHRAQAAGRLAGRAGGLRRPRRARDPRRPFALHAADFAGKRFSRSQCRRDDAQLQDRRPPISSA